MGISQAALGALLNIAGPSVVKVVDELERKRLIRRDPTSDRRVYAKRLTDQGLADLGRYRATVERFEAKIAERLSSSERTQLLRLLAKVAPDQAATSDTARQSSALKPAEVRGFAAFMACLRKGAA